MARIVYHGTFESQPPHEYDDTFGTTFHAGTERAAWDRIDDELKNGIYWEEDDIAKEEGRAPSPKSARIYKYEIADTAPMSRRVWDDPYSESERAVPEGSKKRVYPYTNMYEDEGSTSYVVPRGFVGDHVKYLGVQFEGHVGE